MNKEECKNQIESLIEAWKLEEADLNQTDINAMEEMLVLIDKLESNWKALKEWLDDISKQFVRRMSGNYDVNLHKVLSKINELEGTNNEQR